MLNLGTGDFFFHIPRCGGNYTIRTAKGLRKNGKKLAMSHFGHKHGSPLNTTRTDIRRSFTIIRHPFDWYLSFYRFRIYKHYGKRNMDPGHHLDFFIWKKAGGKVFSFDYFLNQVAEHHPWGYVTEMFCRFFPFVTTFLWLPEITTTLPLLLTDWGYDTPIALPPKPKNESPKDIPAKCSQSTKERIMHTERGIINHLYNVAKNGEPYIFNMEL